MPRVLVSCVIPFSYSNGYSKAVRFHNLVNRFSVSLPQFCCSPADVDRQIWAGSKLCYTTNASYYRARFFHSNCVVQSPSLFSVMKKKKNPFLQGISDLMYGTRVDEEVLQSLEDALYGSDVGLTTTKYLISKIRAAAVNDEEDPKSLQYYLRNEILSLLTESQKFVNHKIRPLNKQKLPTVLLIIGVNGSGKTTTVGKLVRKYKKHGRKILLAAADTYRAAAVDQLAKWAEQTNVPIVVPVVTTTTTSTGSTINLDKSKDPKSVVSVPPLSSSAIVHDSTNYTRNVFHESKTSVEIKRDNNAESVVFNAIRQAQGSSPPSDLVIIDTAGRFHSNAVFMSELRRIYKMCSKARKHAPDHVWLIIDATSGLNSIIQARAFVKNVPVNGVILTKLDSNAKAGVILTIAKELRLPIVWTGVGEKLRHLKPFDVESYIEAIIGPINTSTD